MRALPLAVSMGDPAGIGPDIILKAWADRTKYALPDLFVVGDIDFLRSRADILGLDITVSEFGSETKPDDLPVVQLGITVEGRPGVSNITDAEATIASINKAVEMTMNGTASAVVTCPINKKALYDVGFAHPGHTEYLAELSEQWTETTVKPVMMLAGPELRTVPVTIHIPLQEVPKTLTSALIVETCEITARDLKDRLAISAPILAIAGLNPHAGENGSMGDEDASIIAPAVEALNAKGINAIGPLPADTMFHATARTSYDVAICMYHDQALIPAKTLAFDEAVNVTLGLPFIRTSPDHGTAYDIAGTGKANPSSFIAALEMAAGMASGVQKA